MRRLCTAPVWVRRSVARTRRSRAARRAGQPERPQAGGVEQRQPGQGFGVDAVGLGVPGQEAAQVGRLLRAHPEHPMPAGGEEDGDGQPGRAGGFHHHLQRGPPGQPASATARSRSGSRRSASLALRHRRAFAVEDPHGVRRSRCPGRCRPGAGDHLVSFVSYRLHRLARRSDARTATVPRRHAQPRLPLMCCNRTRPLRIGPLPSSGASVAGPGVAISATRPGPRDLPQSLSTPPPDQPG